MARPSTTAPTIRCGWGPVLGAPVLVRLPPRGAGGRPYRLTLVVEAGPFALPVYLSQLYLGSEAALVPAFKWRDFLDVDVRTMSLAVQVLLGAGILLAWLMRPRGALLSWVAVFMALTIVEDIAMFLGFQPVLRPVLPYLVAFVPAWGLLTAILALLLIEERPLKGAPAARSPSRRHCSCAPSSARRLPA